MLRLCAVAACLAATLVVAGGAVACRRPNMVFGTVTVAPGIDETVEGVVVAVYMRPDSLRVPFRTVKAVMTGSTRRARFEIGGLPLGDYWLRAWKDVNNDGLLSDGDLSGLLGGGSARDSTGRRFWMGEGWKYDVGDIELEWFKELVIRASGERYAQDTLTSFFYSFNHDVMLTSLAVRFPFYGEYPDGNAPGSKHADSVYLSSGWHFGGVTMPLDTHWLTFRGLMDNDTFYVRVAVRVE